MTEYVDRFNAKITAYKQIRSSLFAHSFNNHTSNKKLFRNRVKSEKIHCVDAKPRGLWYSTDSSWLDFISEHLTNRLHKHIHALEINTSRMLLITNLIEFLSFECEFKGKAGEGEYPGFRQQLIDWKRVVSQYAGIQISPAQYGPIGDAFEHHYWYAHWDCASGCIWDKTAVKSVKLIASYNAEAKSYIFNKNTA